MSPSFEFHKFPFSRNLANGFEPLVFVVVLKHTLLAGMTEGNGFVVVFDFRFSTRMDTKPAYMA